MRVGMRVYYSSYHLWATEHFSYLAAEIEDAHVGPKRLDVRHRAYVTGSLLSSVAFLEATVNELFQDAADRHEPYLSALTADQTRAMAAVWRGNKAKVPILDKYQLALALCGLDRSGQPPRGLPARDARSQGSQSQRAPQ